MTKEAERGAYLRALGIEQWQPRARPLPTSLEPESEPVAAPPVESPARVLPPLSDVAPAAPSSVQPSVIAPVEPVAVTTADAAPVSVAGPLVEEITPAPALGMPRDHLQDSDGIEALALAQVQWRAAPVRGTRLAVLGVDASGSLLAPHDFEQDWGVLQKMLAAIGEELDRCAVGGLQWSDQPSQSLNTPYALILVDSGGDGGALINYWQDKFLTVQGARAVIAPHPRMFGQGVALKRQAWASLQMLQQLWNE